MFKKLKLTLALRVSFLVLRAWADASGAKLHVSGPALRSALDVFLSAGAKLVFLLLGPTAPNSMPKKLTLVLRVLFLDFCRVFAGASVAILEVSGPVLC